MLISLIKTTTEKAIFTHKKLWMNKPYSQCTINKPYEYSSIGIMNE